MLQPLSRAGAAEPLPPPTETGLLGAFQLKRAWARQRARRQGVFDGDQRDFHLDQLVFDALGIGLEQTIQHLGRSALSFEEFERWIVATTGGVSERQGARINAGIAGTEYRRRSSNGSHPWIRPSRCCRRTISPSGTSTATWSCTTRCRRRRARPLRRRSFTIS